MLSRRSLSCAAFLTVALVPVLSSASTRRHDRADNLYQALGAGFGSVGALTIGGAGGSATLIGNNWILTAAHVKDGGGGASTGAFTLNGVTYNVTNIVNHPDWIGGSFAHDFALGFISSGVAGTPSGYYSGDEELGRIATSVGFGGTGTGQTGQTAFDGKKRGFTNFIDARNLDGRPGLLADFDDPAGNSNTLAAFGSAANPTALEGNVAQGDSGGGLFVDFSGKQLLVGVTSYDFGPVGSPIGAYGHQSGWADLTVGAAWIQQITGIAPANAPVPEPASMAVLGVGAAALLRRRAKRR